MRKIIKTFLVFAITAVYLTISAAAADIIKINDLIENIAGFDGKQVAVEGEAIGETLEREEYAWVNINDGTNAIGVWLTAEDTEKITYYGDYKHSGDILRITGTFSRDCKEHGGDVDIHCSQIEIVSKGYVVGKEVSHDKVIAAITLFTAALAVTFVYLIIRKPNPTIDNTIIGP